MWKQFVSKEGRFSVRLPGMPTEEIGFINIPNGKIDVRIYTLDQVKNSGIMYMFSYSDYPQEYLNNTDPESILNGARDGAVIKSKGALLFEKGITKGGLKGRELKIKIGEDMIIRGHIYIFKNRLYQITAISKDDKKSIRVIKRYIDSFRHLL